MTNYDGLYKPSYYGEKLFENHFSAKKLGFQVIENATVLPLIFENGKINYGGIVDGEKNFVERSFIHIGRGESYIPQEKILQSSETVIYIGMMTNIWGHCLTDNIKRLWFLKSKFFKNNFKRCQIIYLNTFSKFIPELLKLFKILEVDVENWREIKQPTKFKKIILPDESFFLDKGATKNYNCAIEGSPNNFRGNDCSFFTKEYVSAIDKIKNFAQKNYSPLPQKKFFFFYGKNQVGEENLANYFVGKGYQPVIPTNFSFEEQLNILLNCENFASTVGSISHNIIFMREKTQAILIPRRAAFLNIYQQALNQIRDMEIFYIDSAFSIFSRKHSEGFCYIISEQLRKFFGDEITEKYSEQDFYNFLLYSKHARKNNLQINPQDEKYFSDLIADFMNCLKQNSKFLKKISR